MGGILVLWNRDGRPVDAGLCHRLQQTLAHRTGVQCLRAPWPGTGAQVAFDGRLDNRDALLDLLGRAHQVDASSSDQQIVAAAYREWGEGLAARLAGDFAVAVFDPSSQTLLLARDPLGVRPLYYYVTPALVLAASEIKAIVAHPDVHTRPNDDVVADYLFNRFAADDRAGVTFFTGVCAVLPSHLVRLTAQDVRVTRYWDFDPGRSLPVRTIEEAADGFREHFTRAVRRQLRSPGPVAISVSGGLDSSAIFCVAERLRREQGGPALIGCSYTVADGLPSDEKVYLAEIERMYGVAIHQWQHLPTGTVDGSREGIRHLEAPALDARWTGTLAYYRAMRDLGAQTLLTGHYGDQFLVQNGFFADLLVAGRFTTIWRDLAEYRRWKDHGAGDVLRTVPRAIARALLPAAALRGARRLRRSRIDHELAGWFTPAFVERAVAARQRPAPEPPPGRAHARALYRQARSRYHVFGMEWNNKLAAMHGLDAAFPFLDRDLIAYLMALPGELLTFEGVPKAVMRVALRGVLPDALAARRSKADFSEDVNSETAQDYGRLVALVRAGGRAAAHGFLRRDASGEAAGEAVRGTDRTPSADADTCTLSWALTDVLSLELWLQEFFDAQGHGTD